MPAERRVVDIYWDVTDRVHRNSSGEALRQGEWPFVFYSEQPLIRLRLVTDANLTAYDGFDPSVDYAFLAALDDDFNPSSTVLALAGEDAINLAGDWAGDSSADSSAAEGIANFEDGEFSIRLDCFTNEMLTALGSNSRIKSATLELQALDSSSSSASINGPVAIFQIPITVRNKIYTSGNPTNVGSFTAAGRVSIGSGANTVAVSGLSLASTNYTVVATVEAPTSSDFRLFASLDGSTKATSGFTMLLSGNTDSANYVLHYIVTVD